MDGSYSWLVNGSYYSILIWLGIWTDLIYPSHNGLTYPLRTSIAYPYLLTRAKEGITRGNE